MLEPKSITTNQYTNKWNLVLKLISKTDFVVYLFCMSVLYSCGIDIRVMKLSSQMTIHPLSILCPLVFFANMTLTNDNQVTLKYDLKYHV